MNENDLSSVYQGASVFVYPSLYEGFGLPPLEALASGIPTIAFNSPSMHVNFTLKIDKDHLARLILNLIERALLPKIKIPLWKETAIKTLETYSKIIQD